MYVQRIDPIQVDPRLDVRVSQAAEAIIGLSLFLRTDVTCQCYDIGCTGFDDLRTAMSDDLRREVAAFRSDQFPKKVLHPLLAELAEAPMGLREYLRHLDRRADASMRPLLGLLARWYNEVFTERWEEIGPVLTRDVGAKLRRGRSVMDVVEEATNGGEYVPEAGVDRLLLLPTYLGRPWVFQSRRGSTLVIVYPVSDIAMAASAEEARRLHLLRVSKALADETRLRALRCLAAESWTLQELADELGVRKSTMHHHLAVLRSAGLLRLRFSEKRYSLRKAPLAELSGLLGEYVGAGPRRR